MNTEKPSLDHDLSLELVKAFDFVLGGTGLAALLAAGELTSSVDALHNANGMLALIDVDAMLAALEQVYGARGASAILPRIFDRFIHQAFAGKGIFMAFDNEAFAMLPARTKLSVGLAAVLAYFRNQCDLNLALNETGDRIQGHAINQAGQSWVKPFLEVAGNWILNGSAVALVEDQTLDKPGYLIEIQP